jgi:hypothetical protein
MNLLWRWTGASFCAFALAVSTLSADETKQKPGGQPKNKKETETIVGDINVSIQTSGVDSKTIIEHLTKSLETAGASQKVQAKVIAEVKQKLDASGASAGKSGEVTIKVDAIAGQPNAIFMDKDGKQHRIQLKPRQLGIPRAETITKHQDEIVKQATKQTEQISKQLETLQKQMGANGIRLHLGSANPKTGILWIDPSTQNMPEYSIGIGIARGKHADEDSATESDDDRESSQQESDADDEDSAQDQVVVTDVFDDTPATAAGLKPGDVLTKLNGEPVTRAQQVRDAVASAGKADAEIELEWNRNGEIYSAKIKPKKNEPAFVEGLRLNLNSLDSAIYWDTTDTQPPSSEVEALKERVEQLEKELAEIKQLIPNRDK